MTCKNSHTLFSQTARKGSAAILAMTCGNALSSLPRLTSQQPRGQDASCFGTPERDSAASHQPSRELTTRSHEAAIASRCLVLLQPDRRPCPDPACSPLGFCWRHLAEAAAEHTRLVPQGHRIRGRPVVGQRPGLVRAVRQLAPPGQRVPDMGRRQHGQGPCRMIPAERPAVSPRRIAGPSPDTPRQPVETQAVNPQADGFTAEVSSDPAAVPLRSSHQQAQPGPARRASRPGRPRLLVVALNAALGLELADFAEAREFMLSEEGAQMLEDWLAARHGDDSGEEQVTTKTEGNTGP
jgi:hypothetical protein